MSIHTSTPIFVPLSQEHIKFTRNFWRERKKGFDENKKQIKDSNKKNNVKSYNMKDSIVNVGDYIDSKNNFTSFVIEIFKDRFDNKFQKIDLHDEIFESCVNLLNKNLHIYLNSFDKKKLGYTQKVQLNIINTSEDRILKNNLETDVKFVESVNLEITNTDDYDIPYEQTIEFIDDEEKININDLNLEDYELKIIEDFWYKIKPKYERQILELDFFKKDNYTNIRKLKLLELRKEIDKILMSNFKLSLTDVNIFNNLTISNKLELENANTYLYRLIKRSLISKAKNINAYDKDSMDNKLNKKDTYPQLAIKKYHDSKNSFSKKNISYTIKNYCSPNKSQIEIIKYIDNISNEDNIITELNNIKDIDIINYIRGLIDRDLEIYKNEFIEKWKIEIYDQKINQYQIAIEKHIKNNILLSDSITFNTYIIELKNKGYSDIIIDYLKTKLNDLYIDRKKEMDDRKLCGLLSEIKVFENFKSNIFYDYIKPLIKNKVAYVSGRTIHYYVKKDNTWGIVDKSEFLGEISKILISKIKEYISLLDDHTANVFINENKDIEEAYDILKLKLEESNDQSVINRLVKKINLEITDINLWDIKIYYDFIQKYLVGTNNDSDRIQKTELYDKFIEEYNLVNDNIIRKAFNDNMMKVIDASNELKSIHSSYTNCKFKNS